jgi:hypothetical protein
MTLRLDWCSYDAARYACEHWHYSKCMPAGKLVRVGVWESEQFIGAVVFGSGANRNIGKPYKLGQHQVCELVRVALRRHASQVSKILAIAVRLVKKQFTGLRVIISYADPEQGHHGGIYQACNWAYMGKSKAQQAVIVRGAVMHKRSASALFGTIKGLKRSEATWKHTYAFALDGAAWQMLAEYVKPYPKRVGSADSGTGGDQPSGDGASPISTLQITAVSPEG